MSKFPDSVKSITIVCGDDEHGEVVVLQRRRGRKKRGSRGLRPLDKLVRRFADADEKFFEKYLHWHDRSNEKRKDGWLRDIVSNTSRAISPAARKITR